MTDRRDEGHERIAVAAPRSPTRQPSRRGAHPVQTASDAGLAWIVVMALLAAAGWAIGGTLGAAVAGALIGGFVGLLVGFAAIYLRYRDL